jgi:anti-sigma factor RsiW
MCPKDEYLSAYLDNEIGAPWDKKIESHVRGCARCQERIEAFRSLSSLLHAEDLPEIAEESRRVEQRIKFTLQHRTPPIAPAYSGEEGHIPFWKRQVLLPMPVFAGAFVALLVLVASLFFFMGRNGSELMQAKNELEKLRTVNVYYPLQDPQQVLKVLKDKNVNEDVVIQLPETGGFKLNGEPQIIYVNNAGKR